jgi:hypothetical protein
MGKLNLFREILPEVSQNAMDRNAAAASIPA